MYKCLESQNSIYIDKSPLGYIVKPCCLFREKNGIHTVSDIKDINNNDYIKDIQNHFLKDDWKREECSHCIRNESLGKVSKRERSLERGNIGHIVSWDIRPGNTCNLKCIMCNPFNSSKWYEDIDLYNEFTYLTKANPKDIDRTGLDWDYIINNCLGKAKNIYIAGGEPFYMKNVQKFIELLSKDTWNRKNTTIRIQTNGVSNNNKFLENLSKFDRLVFNISIDGWGPVNELIRYPTSHKTLIQNTNELYKIANLKKTRFLNFNITAQCLNLPNLDKTYKKLESLYNAKPEIHILKDPKFLSINCLKPQVIEGIETDNELLLSIIKTYKYDEEQNKKMQKFVLAMDEKRGTNSKEITPWIYV